MVWISICRKLDNWWAAVHGVAKSRTCLSDFTFTFTFLHWRRKWQPTPVFFLGESQGQWSLVGCHLRGRRVRHDWSDLAAAAIVIIAYFLFITCALCKNLTYFWHAFYKWKENSSWYNSSIWFFRINSLYLLVWYFLLIILFIISKRSPLGNSDLNIRSIYFESHF